MKKNNETLNHALHNEEVCTYLSLKKEFSDWIITTAFYTSVHFVSYKIFPFKIKGKNDSGELIIEDIFQYQNFMGEGDTSRHKIMGDLVQRFCNDIFVDYSRLHDMSKNARYINYRQPPEVANKTVTLMGIIKKFCTKVETPKAAKK